MNETPVSNIPMGDVFAHEDDETCPCGPELLRVEHPGGDRWILAHHALDGREERE
jgi:hypothetical protein